MEKKYFNSFDEKAIPYLYFKSKREYKKNNIIIFHGMTEPVTRYEEFSDFLSSNGYDVYVMEIRGHGELKQENYGDFGKKGINGIFEDIEYFFNILKNNGINRENTVIFGHSMGSLISMEYFIEKQYKYLILSGFPLQRKLISRTGQIITLLERALIFKKKSLFNSQFRKYNKFFEPNNTMYDWLSRDENEVKKYSESDECGYSVTPKFFYGIFKMMNFINRKYKKVSKDSRILFIYGDQDKAMDIKYVNKMFKKIKNKKRKVSMLVNENGRHESLNETNKYKIYDEILKWLNETIKI